MYRYESIRFNAVFFFRGNTIEWYNKFWCNIAAAKLLSLKMLFADLKK